MLAVKQNILELIGNTPLVELKRFASAHAIKARLLAKLEYLNPFGSVKDRIGLAMIETAESQGCLHPGAVIIEPTSGNTGIGLAAVAAIKGYRTILTMPDTMSLERRRLLAAYGAELVLTEGDMGMPGAIAKAAALVAEIPNSFMPAQFDNPANPAAHYRTTGPEVWRDSNGDIDAFVACVGSGGTITGVGEYLREQNSSIRIAAVEPAESPVLSGGKIGSHGIQGIGAGFVPAILNISIYDEIIPVTTENAIAATKEAARQEGILVGISSGAALWAACRLASRQEFAGKTVVALLPDTGERYLSSGVFN